MGNDSGKILVAGNGHLYVAATGSTAPTDATTALAAAFYDLGYIAEEGASITPGKDVTEIRAWQSFYALRRIVTARTLEIAAALRQVDFETVKLAFDGGTVTGGPTAWKYVPPDPSTIDERALVLEGIDGSRVYRWYFPKVMVTSVGAVSFSRNAAVDLPLTFGVNQEAGADAFSLFVSDAEFSAT